MWQLVARVLVSATVLVAVAELAKRSSWIAALLASLPLTSLLAFVWLWHDTHDPERVAQLAGDILWLVLPSLALFVALPVLLRRGLPFWPSLAAASAVTVCAYALLVWWMRRTGMQT